MLSVSEGVSCNTARSLLFRDHRLENPESPEAGRNTNSGDRRNPEEWFFMSKTLGCQTNLVGTCINACSLTQVSAVYRSFSDSTSSTQSPLPNKFHRIFACRIDESLMHAPQSSLKMLLQSSLMDGVVGKRGDQSLEKISETIVPSNAKLFRMDSFI